MPFIVCLWNSPTCLSGNDHGYFHLVMAIDYNLSGNWMVFAPAVDRLRDGFRIL